MDTSRRDFFKKAVVLAGAGIAVPSMFGSFAMAQDAASLPWVKPGEGMAANLHYVENKKDLKDKSLKIERQGVAFEKQQCSGCALFMTPGKKEGQDAGKCPLFSGSVVKGTSWCQSWSKKQG